MRESIVYPITYDRDVNLGRQAYRWDFVISDWKEVVKWKPDDFGQFVDAIGNRAREAESRYRP